MRSLQNKIFFFFVLLLLLVQAISVWTIIQGNKLQEDQEIQNRLTTANTIFTELFNSRKSFLSSFAETVSKDYGIKQLVEDDTRSLLFALNNHRKRIDADLAMAISAEENVIAQLYVKTNDEGNKKVKKGPEINEPFRYKEWLNSDEPAHLYILNKKLYQVSLSPITIGSKTIGWLAFGYKIDKELATYFKKITHLETDFLLQENEQWKLLTSSNNTPKLAASIEVINGNKLPKYISTGQVIKEFEEHQFAVVMYGLKADITELLQKRWWQFLLLAGFTLLLSLTVAYIIAASITRPIRFLVKQAKVIASGDYKHTVDIKDNNELGQLAHEFNTMQEAVLLRENKIKHSANHDKLTSLPNKNALNQTLQTLVENNEKFAFFHLNVSRLQDVNETLGHDVGDWLIQQAARLLMKVPNKICLTHAGADEFIMLFKAETEEHVMKINTDIHCAVEQLCTYQEIKLQLQVKCGVALFPSHSSNVKEIMQMADIALHHARKRNQSIQIYKKELNVNSVERLKLINDLKHAIADNQLELHYQPKLNLKTNYPDHVEALVRWSHPTLGMIPPDNFIHIAEQTGQINALTNWVYATAIKQYNQWLSAGISINIAINISAENLKSPDFFNFICKTAHEADVPANKITLEITESAVVDDPETAIALLKKFKLRGMKLSIDDYGTGYSSLAQLKQLPVHELKIDKSFVQRLCEDEDDRIIVRSTIELAHNMGLSVVAEGIEDEFALNWLTQHGCELAQGYYISRPQPASKLTPWLLEKFNT